jgi:hypothetical protein
LRTCGGETGFGAGGCGEAKNRRNKDEEKEMKIRGEI